ncbi:MAG: transporter substrate-binding domain-containing protein [Oscillospiraceae bacterium]|nr:transporter substrate-binding domain-containing protein [Oscillospiraceae bacterium]
MKKLLALLLALTLVLTFAACGAGQGGATAPEINSPGDLSTAGIRIGVQLGTTGHVFANENFSDAEVMAYDTNSDVILALLGGDVDAVIMDSEPARNFVAQNEGRIRQLDELLTQEGYGISLALGSPYTDLFDEAINTLRENGVLYGLIDYWVNEDPNASRYESPAGTTHPNGTLFMGTNADFPPFEFWEYGQIVGLDPDIARAIGDLLGYAIEIIDMDFGAIILSVQTGQVDFGMAGMTITEERREMVDFTQAYFLSGQSIIVRVS